MKNLILGVLTVASFSSYASANTLSEEKMLDLKEAEISRLQPSNDKEVRIKKSLLSKIKLAKEGFKEWKDSNPNHKEIRKAFKEVSKKIQTDGSPENLAIKSALKRCESDERGCDSILKSNIESIYTNSEISTLAQNKGFKVISSAYASGATVDTCSWAERAYYKGSDGGGQQFFAGMFGSDKACGLTFVGPGLGISPFPSHFQICIGDGMGTNVGPYVSANALFGVGVGMTVGQGGVCQILSFGGLSFGAFAGAVITEDFGPKSRFSERN